MDSNEFPPNSRASKGGRPEDRKITPVATGAVRRKRSLRKQFSETFIGGDFRSTVNYVLLDVLLVSARDTIVEVVTQGIEKLVLGDSRRSRGAAARPNSGPTGIISYNQYAAGSHRQAGPQRTISRQARSKHNFDEIVLTDRSEGEEVLERLGDLVSEYDFATVADLYELTGLPSTHTDFKWGWTDLYGSGLTRIRGGYLLDLPAPEPVG